MARRIVADRVYEGADIIDSRDIMERVAELTELRAEATDDAPMDDDDLMELAKLESLVDEAANCAGDWPDGAALIAEHHFEEYAQELAEDIGAVPKDLSWPACHIDWTAAAEALKMDYSSVTYGTTEYWVRS